MKEGEVLRYIVESTPGVAMEIVDPESYVQERKNQLLWVQRNNYNYKVMERERFERGEEEPFDADMQRGMETIEHALARRIFETPTKTDPPQEDPSPYIETRGILLQRALERRHETARNVRNLEEGVYTVPVPPEHFNPLRDKYKVEDYTVSVDSQFVRGIQTVVDSLIHDLYDTGTDGQQMAANIIYDVQQKEMGKERR